MTFSSAATAAMPPKREQRSELSAAGTALGALGMTAVVGVFAALLHMLAEVSPRIGPVFQGWSGSVNGSPIEAVRWFLGDMTEPLFFKSDLAAAGLLAGAVFAWWAGRRRKRWAGELSYGTGLWPWVFASAALSLALSNAAFGRMLDGGWQPTFVPFVCVAPAMVLVYGGGWKQCLTGAVLGAATTTPLALLLIPTVSAPLGLPAVVANVLAMALGSAVSFAVARKLPWLVALPVAPHKVEPATKTSHPASGPSLKNDTFWAARRVLKDFTETHFFANEVASAGVILGVGAAFALNPGLPSYGSNLLPGILFAQALTSAFGVVLWREWFRDGGWAATYASMVSVAPAAVLAFNGSWTSIIGGALLGALVAPPLARGIAKRLPAGYHPVIANTAAMAISTAVVLPILGLLPQ